ncbi:MAG: hypothetical protein AAB436_02900 [Patescibacteria group bacterium]
MVVFAHVVIALSSLIYATYLFFRPSIKGLRASSGLVALTLVSGSYLVLLQPSHMVSACMSGLAYLAFVSSLMLAAYRRYAKQNI